MPRLTLIVWLLVLFMLQACNKTPDKIISINPSEYPPEDQLKIGEAFQEQIENNPQAFKILSHTAYPEAYDYLNLLFRTLINTSEVEHRKQYDWTLDIIQNDSVCTAFFLPGGHFYVYTGLLKLMDTESQFLGVVGHELYYVNSEVLIRKMAEEFGGTNLGDILLGNEVEHLSDLALAMPSLSFEEEKVMLADSFSVKILCPFQYEPIGIKSILEKVGSNELHCLWLDTRSANFTNRINYLELQALDCGLPGVVNQENYQNFKNNYLP